MNLEYLRQQYINDGFTLANASAKVCQDVILSKISKSTLSNNVTIKGGVVMYGLSNDKRRATRDLDMDFIKYSLDNQSIKLFIKQLNKIDDGIVLNINGEIEKLHHHDYDGKRINLILSDNYGFTINTKLDIGVHNNFNIEQEEYCFNLDVIGENAILFINSKEQILCEKLKSLLKFGIRSTRYKDIFDFYFLINYTNLKKDKLVDLINILIINDDMMRENNLNDIINDLKIIFNNRNYLKQLENAKNNWLGISVDEVINNIISYFETIEYINV